MNSDNRTDEINSLNGEREMPNVNESKSSATKRSVMVIIIALIVGVAVLVGVLKYRSFVASKEEAASKNNQRLKSAVPTRTFTEPLAQKVFEEEERQEAAKAQPIATAPIAPVVIEKPTVDKSASSLMIVADNAPRATNDASANKRTSEGEGRLTGQLSSTKTLKRSALFIGDRNYILAKGRFINCALSTRLDSTVPGMTSCVVTRNIYSDNGKVLLVERGSEVSGEYKSNVKHGMARIFVLWSRIKTPNGVVVALDSPGADPLGGSGLPGYIDSHFWDRFGGALLLSLVDDVAAMSCVASCVLLKLMVSSLSSALLVT